jgi:tellurite methyltransferase
MNIRDFFDELYLARDRYWWQGKERYAADPESYRTSLITQQTLRALAGRRPGRALDLGAGEGSDSIRLAKLGYNVYAVEVSKVGADKISAFAKEAGVAIDVEVADVTEYQPDGYFDVVVCNGVLHYIADKSPVVERMQKATRSGGINVISLWSTYTPVPESHLCVPVFCDDEDGVVAKMYEGWGMDLSYLERNKPETSHGGMPAHSHSHIKMIARKP